MQKMTNFNTIWREFLKGDNSSRKKTVKRETLTENTDIYGKTDENILGKWAWPSADRHLRDIIDEPDTEIEKNLYIQLHKHFGAVVKDGAPIDQESVAAIKQILASGDYSNVFKQCKGTGNLVRGISVPLEWIQKHAPEALEKMPDTDGELDWTSPDPISYPYESAGKYGNISSWTADEKVARRFASTVAKPGNIPCILYADCTTGLFLDTSPFEKYAGGDYNYDDGKKIKKLNPQGKKEVEYLLFGDCEVNAIQLRGNKPTQINEKLLREITEDELGHIEDVLDNIDPDEMPFNNLFQGKMRLLLPFSALEPGSEIGKFIRFWDSMHQGYGDEQEAVGWKWEPNFSTGKATRKRPIFKDPQAFQHAEEDYREKNLMAMAGDLIGGAPDSWTRPETPKRSPETMKIGKILNKIASLIPKYKEIAKKQSLAGAVRTARTGEVSNEKETALTDEERKTGQRLYNALYNLVGNHNTLQYVLSNAEQVQKYARFWELTGAALFKGDENAGRNDNYAIIVTRSPVDILRMADFDNIESCHSPPSRATGDVSYYKCVVAEAQGHGAVAYIVATEDLFNEYEGTTLEEIENEEDFQTEEVFWDEKRDEGRLEPISRVRLRQMRYWEDEIYEGEVTDLAVPEARTYGQKFEDFRKTMVKWATENQEEQLKAAPRKDGEIDLDKFVKYGGSYEDNNSDTLLINMFPDGTKTYGSITQNTETEDALDANMLGDVRAIWEEECQALTDNWNHNYAACQVGFDVTDDGANGFYIEVASTMRLRWDEGEWEKWPNAQDVSYILQDAKEYGWFQWMNADYPSSFQKMGRKDGVDKFGFFFAIEPNEEVWEYGEYANDPSIYNEWCEAVDKIDDQRDAVKEIITRVAKEQGWMKGGKFQALARKVHDGDLSPYEWEVEVDGDYDDAYEITASTNITVGWDDLVLSKINNISQQDMQAIVNSRDLRLAFRADVLGPLMKGYTIEYWLNIDTSGNVANMDEYDIEFGVMFNIQEDSPDEQVDLFLHLIEDADDEDDLRDSLILSIIEVIKEHNIQENISRYTSKNDKFFVKRWKENFKR